VPTVGHLADLQLDEVADTDVTRGAHDRRC
jgi:hypothetical protein